MDDSCNKSHHEPWNKGKLVGQKAHSWCRRQIEPLAERQLIQGKRVASAAGPKIRFAQAGSPRSRHMAQFIVGGSTLLQERQVHQHK